MIAAAHRRRFNRNRERMKLARFGPAGRENPGVIDSKGRIRDLSGVVPDIAGESMALKVSQPWSAHYVSGAIPVREMCGGFIWFTWVPELA
jgi:hypothetical protein